MWAQFLISFIHDFNLVCVLTSSIPIGVMTIATSFHGPIVVVWQASPFKERKGLVSYLYGSCIAAASSAAQLHITANIVGIPQACRLTNHAGIYEISLFNSCNLLCPSHMYTLTTRLRPSVAI